MKRIDLRLNKINGQKHAVGAGFFALDMIEGRKKIYAAGGSCGNVMAILAWMGWHSIPVGRLGIDQAGEFILEELNGLGLNTENLIQDSTVKTPLVVQKFVVSKDGQRTHRFSLTCPDCRSWLPRFRSITLKQADPLVESKLKPKIFYFDKITPASLKLAKWAKEKGALVMFEPYSINDDRHFQHAVDICHILKYSDVRLGHIPDLEKTKHPKIIVKTLGASGVEMRWRNRWSRMEAFVAPKFEDAAGSGDWCSAGILHHLGRKGAIILKELRKSDLDRSVRFGQALAAINCGYEGARGLMEFMDEKILNRALQSLEMSENIEDWGKENEDYRVFPDKFCDLCSQPYANYSKHTKILNSS